MVESDKCQRNLIVPGASAESPQRKPAAPSRASLMKWKPVGPSWFAVMVQMSHSSARRITWPGGRRSVLPCSEAATRFISTMLSDGTSAPCSGASHPISARRGTPDRLHGVHSRRASAPHGRRVHRGSHDALGRYRIGALRDECRGIAPRRLACRGPGAPSAARRVRGGPPCRASRRSYHAHNRPLVRRAGRSARCKRRPHSDLGHAHRVLGAGEG